MPRTKLPGLELLRQTQVTMVNGQMERRPPIFAKMVVTCIRIPETRCRTVHIFAVTALSASLVDTGTMLQEEIDGLLMSQLGC